MSEGTLHGRLRALTGRPIDSPADGRVVEEAARLLTMLLEMEERVAVLEGGATPPPEGEMVGEHAPAYGDFKTLPLHEAARRVLLEDGFVMHARTLAIRLYIRGWRPRRTPDAKPRRIADQIAARLPRHPETFVRVAPNTFWLVGVEARPRPRPTLPLFSGPGDLDAKALTESDDAYQPDPWQ